MPSPPPSRVDEKADGSSGGPLPPDKFLQHLLTRDEYNPEVQSWTDEQRMKWYATGERPPGASQPTTVPVDVAPAFLPPTAPPVAEPRIPGMSPGGPVDPQVKQWFAQIAAVAGGRGKAPSKAKAPKGRGKRMDGPPISLMMPGMSPGGPVDAPLWPTDGGSSPMPTLQSAGSLGAPAAAQTMGAPAAHAAPTSGETMSALLSGNSFNGPSSLGLDQNDQRLQSLASALQLYGIQGFGPQTFERESKSEMGLLQNAFNALGLSPEDAQQAYEQTRWHQGTNANAY